MRFAKVFLSFGVIVLCVLLIGGTSAAIQKHVAKSIYDSSPRSQGDHLARVHVSEER